MYIFKTQQCCLLALVLAVISLPYSAQAFVPGAYSVICDPDVGHPEVFDQFGNKLGDLSGPCGATTTYQSIVVLSDAAFEAMYGTNAPPVYVPAASTVNGLTAQQLVDKINNEFVAEEAKVNEEKIPPSSFHTLHAAESHFSITMN